MNLTPHYQVDVFHGRLGEENETQTKKFENADLKQARQEALKFAFEMERAFRSATDSPNLVRETPVLTPMLIATSVGVSFVIDEEESYQIYGESIHDTLGALVEEASYYERNKLIESDQLIKVLQNSNERDKDNPPFELASFVEEMPDFNYVVIKVLPYQLGDILRETTIN